MIGIISFKILKTSKYLLTFSASNLFVNIFQKKVKIPMVFTNNRNTFPVENKTSNFSFASNHSDTDKWVVLHVCLANCVCLTVLIFQNT